MATNTHIRALLVDDDVEIGELLGRYLEKFGIDCLAVTDGKAMHRQLAAASFDLILLDLMLPGEDGLSLLRTLRSDAKTSHIPILMLTARGEFTDKIIGLELGADDYVVKPFDARELVARIYTVLRRSNAEQQARHPQANKEIVFNRRRLDCQSRQLTTTGNQIIPLSNAEFRLLMAFIERPERVLSREQLLDIARGKSADMFDRSIDLLVSRLRRKLDDDPSEPSMLKTVRGEGYMFTLQA
jgi:two-component system OmpR family response regulator